VWIALKCKDFKIEVLIFFEILPSFEFNNSTSSQFPHNDLIEKISKEKVVT
jgi:hypothetical protein